MSSGSCLCVIWNTVFLLGDVFDVLCQELQISDPNFNIFGSRNDGDCMKIVQVAVFVFLEEFLESYVRRCPDENLQDRKYSYLTSILCVAVLENCQAWWKVAFNSWIVAVTTNLHHYLVCFFYIGNELFVSVGLHKFKDRRMKFVDENGASSTLHFVGDWCEGDEPYFLFLFVVGLRNKLDDSGEDLTLESTVPRMNTPRWFHTL